MTKFSYTESKHKKEVRDFLLQQFEFKNVIGLAGPDINEYINNIRFANCNKIQIYENNSAILFKQLYQLGKQDKNISINYSNIYNVSPIQENTLYDLDFCATVRTLKDCIKKFKDNFIMTFSLRPAGFKETIETFFKEREEEVVSFVKNSLPLPHLVFNTNAGKYIYISYRDGSPMCCIAKIN